MGAGAALDSGLGDTTGERYFCHSCHRVFGLGGVQSPQDYYCPHCHSTFLEELGGRGRGGTELFAMRMGHQGQLSSDQARRITNATAMLRLLESQLREELEHLQHAFESANARVNGNDSNKKKLTNVMTGRCRIKQLNLDMVCSQPGCPICSEDFELGSEAYRLPCSHLFHKDCVMPWLDMKQNCPICRAELSDEMPTTEELKDFTVEELKERLKELDVEVMDSDVISNDRDGLTQLLLQHWQQQKQEESETNPNNSDNTSGGNSMGPFLRRGYFPEDANPHRRLLFSIGSDRNSSSGVEGEDENQTNDEEMRIIRTWERSINDERSETDRILNDLERSTAGSSSTQRPNFGFVISSRQAVSDSLSGANTSDIPVFRPMVFASNVSTTRHSSFRTQPFGSSGIRVTSGPAFDSLHSHSLDSRRAQELENNNDARFPIWLRNNDMPASSSSTRVENNSWNNLEQSNAAVNTSAASTASNSNNSSADNIPALASSGPIGYTFQVRSGGSGNYSTIPMPISESDLTNASLSNASNDEG